VTVNLDDGLDQLAIAKVEEIRDEASYPGIRATVTGHLDRAKLRFHVDINIGDPRWPEPDLVELPQLLHAEPIPVRAYSAELMLAEKIVTAIQRGTASTRWRDFVDIAALAKTQVDMTRLSAALQMVADHRQVSIRPLANVLDGYAELAQSRWSAWRNRQALHTTPEQFADLLDQVITFADPLLQPLTAPGAPTFGSSPITAGDTTLAVAWNAPADTGGAAVHAYSIRHKVSTAGDDTYVTATVDGRSTTHTISGLTNGTQYTVQVRTHTAAGTSAWTTIGTGTPAN